jgi:hypothetical protein
MDIPKRDTVASLKGSANMHLLSTWDRLSTKEAASLLGMSVSWLEKTRCFGFGGPPFRKIGRRVVYVRCELMEWDSSRRIDLPLSASPSTLPAAW